MTQASPAPANHDLPFSPGPLALPHDGIPQQEIQVLRRTLNAQRAALRRLDAAALVPFYAEDLHWANAFGTRLRGRDRVIEYWSKMFGTDGFRARSGIDNETQDVWFLRPDIAVVHAYQEIRGQRTLTGDELFRRNHSEKIVERRAAGWVIVSELFYDEREKNQRLMARAERAADEIRTLRIEELDAPAASS